ncbi:hypothetical protein BTVI_135114 [Pitangus sulphuratus]|nr:hypothetical protein BTVI_135114 [Pitangus sulphuratus]
MVRDHSMKSARLGEDEPDPILPGGRESTYHGSSVASKSLRHQSSFPQEDEVVQDMVQSTLLEPDIKESEPDTRVASVNQQQMVYIVNPVKQVEVKSLGDFMSGSPKLVGETQANEHENVI